MELISNGTKYLLELPLKLFLDIKVDILVKAAKHLLILDEIYHA